MRTLVVSVDRTGDIPARPGYARRSPAGKRCSPSSRRWASRTPRIPASTASWRRSGSRDLRDEDDDAVVAAVSGDGDGVSADRSVAEQLDDLCRALRPDSAVVVIDSAEDERLVPIIESRLQVDAVDRVVVRQARDLESTYYLLKQFLADEELRQTVLVPLGIVMLVFPALMLATGSLAVAAASITAVIGLFLLYKGLSIDDYLAAVPGQARDALYSGRVSIVTYVVAAGLALVGVFAGALGVSDLPAETALLLSAMAFTYYSIPWWPSVRSPRARAACSTNSSDRAASASFLNLPFGVLAVGLVVRGFSAYFMERAGRPGPIEVPSTRFGPLAVREFAFTPEQRLAVFVVLGVLLSVVGIRIATHFSGVDLEDVEEAPERQ